MDQGKYYDSETGALKEIRNYQKDREFGIQKTFYKNKKLKKESYVTDNRSKYSYVEYNERGEPTDLQCGEQYTSKKHEALCNGPVKLYSTSGKLRLDARYLKGQPEGTLRAFHENGKLSGVASFAKGEKNGIWKDFYEDGKPKSVENFRNGKRHGEQLKYSRNGLAKREVIDADKGIVSRLETYYLNGKKKRCDKTEDGKVIHRTYYFDNGKPSQQGDYKAGRNCGYYGCNERAIGTHLYFHENGNKARENTYHDDGPRQTHCFLQ